MRVDTNGTCDSERRLQEVLGAYYEAIEGGATPDPRALIAGHPEFAGDLAEFFALQEDLHHLVAPIRNAAIVPDDTEPATASPLHGRRSIGDYDLLGEIARGGVGIVYRARQRSLNRPVAVKVLRDGADATPADARRFRNEAEMAANLDHPNIIPIYEVGEDQGCSFFSMKLIEGGSLAERVAESGIDPRTAARWMATVARAIQYAHERGILHRDLKPSNVLIDDRREPHVADFGLARRLDGDSDLTRTGMVVGTPSYMAPEQADGRKGIVTTATDVHGLGAVLYFLLTGRPPYGGATTLEVLDRVRASSPKPPSTIHQEVDRDLETICLKCLEPDPARRYPSAGAVSEDLERWLEGRTILARRAGRAERAWRLCRQHPRMAGMMALVILLAATAAAGLFASDRAQRDAAKRARDARHKERALRVELYDNDILQSGQALAANRPDKIVPLLNRHRPAPGEEDRRSFAWHYFHRLGSIGRPPLLGHSHDVHYATFSPDGKSLATAGKDNMVRIWDVQTGSMRSILRGHTSEVNWVSYSPDGRTLATTGDDRTVRVWDAESGTLKSTLSDHDDEVVGVIFTPDGRHVVSCDRKGRVILWNLAGSDTAYSFTVKVGKVQSVAISPDGRLLAISGDVTMIWDLVARCPWNRLATDDRPMNGVAFSHDGASLASACGGAVHVWDTRTWKMDEMYFDGHRAIVESVAFSADDRFLASVCNDGVIHLTDRATGVEQRIAAGQNPGRLWCVAFSPDGRIMATAGANGSVKLWDLERDKVLVPFRVPTRESITFALSPDGDRFIALDRAKNLWIHKTRSGQLLTRKRFAAQGEIVSSVLTNDARRLVTVDKSGTIAVWDVASERRFREIPASVPHFKGFAISPGGERIAKYIRGQGVFVWDEAGGPPRHLTREWGGSWVGMAVSGDGRCAFWGEGHSGPLLWDSVSGQIRLTTSPGHGGLTVAWSFSPDGNILATGGTDGSVILWDAKSLAPVKRVDKAHDDAASAVAFSPDGRTLATGGTDGRVRLWDPESGRELATLMGHSGPIAYARFSADGLTLATLGLGDDGRNEVIIWHAAPRDRAAGDR